MAVIVDQFDRELGIRTRVHETETKTVIEKVYDGQAFRDYAAEERARTEGQNWGPLGRKVGVVPMAELAKMMRHGGELDGREMKKWVRRFLQENPDLVTFSKYLKK
jgi:hypothetical protein